MTFLNSQVVNWLNIPFEEFNYKSKQTAIPGCSATKISATYPKFINTVPLLQKIWCTTCNVIQEERFGDSSS